jgi:hypothetical protein
VSGLPATPLVANDLFNGQEPIAIESGTFELTFTPLEVKVFRFEQAH